MKIKTAKIQSILITAYTKLLITQICKRFSVFDTHIKKKTPSIQFSLGLSLTCIYSGLCIKSISDWQQTFVISVKSNWFDTSFTRVQTRPLAYRYNLISSLGDQNWKLKMSQGDCLENKPLRVRKNPWYMLIQVIVAQQEFLEWFSILYRFLWIFLQLRSKSTCQVGQMYSKSPPLTILAFFFCGFVIHKSS